MINIGFIYIAFSMGFYLLTCFSEFVAQLILIVCVVICAITLVAAIIRRRIFVEKIIRFYSILIIVMAMWALIYLSIADYVLADIL